MVCSLTLHAFLKPCLHLRWLGLFLNLSDQPPTHLGYQPTSHSLSQTLICSYYLSLLDTLNSLSTFRSPTFNPNSSFMFPTFTLHPWQLYSCWQCELSLISEDYHCVRYIPCYLFPMYMLYNWGLPLCQCVTSVQLTPVLEYLCIWVASSQCHPHRIGDWNINRGNWEYQVKK